jgi:rubrerythrin
MKAGVVHEFPAPLVIEQGEAPVRPVGTMEAVVLPTARTEEAAVPPCPTCARHLEEAATAEARNAIRLLHLADVADGLGDHELAAVLVDQADEEQLHAWRLYDLASAPGVDLVTEARLDTPAEILDAALTFARYRAEEAAPAYAALARHPGCEEVATWFERHADACRAQVAALEARRARSGT